VKRENLDAIVGFLMMITFGLSIWRIIEGEWIAGSILLLVTVIMGK
jgi:hypothetical protein